MLDILWSLGALIFDIFTFYPNFPPKRELLLSMFVYHLNWSVFYFISVLLIIHNSSSLTGEVT